MLGGKSLVGLQPHQITRLGIARTFQTLRLFLNLSVRENVMAAAYGTTKAGILRSMLRTPGMRREEARDPRSSAEEHLVVLRRAPQGLPLGSAGLQPLLRQPPPARDRARDGHRREDPAARRARRRHEPGRDARDHRADRPPARRGRLHDPRDRARHARRRGHLEPRDRARPRRQDRRGHVRAGRRPTRRSSRPTSARRRRRPSERERAERRACCELERHQHLLRADPHPAEPLARGARGRARLPARRQRLGQVDDAQDDPRHRQAAHRDDHVRGRGRSRRARPAIASAAASRSCPRTGGCSRR